MKAVVKTSIFILTLLVLTQVNFVQPGHSVSRGKIEIGSNKVVALIKDGILIPACSASLISPDIVVTAAHCIFKTKYIEDPSGLSVAFPGDVVNISAKPRLIQVAKAIPVPTFGGYTDIPYSYDVDDIAFLFLKEPIPDVEAVQIADSSLVNQIKSEEYEIKHYGYGLQKENPYTLEGNPYSVILKATNNPVSAKSPSAKDERVLYSKGTIPGFATCGGDSGGPGYVTVSGVIYLVSVISGAGGCDSSIYLAHTFSTLIYPHLNFLENEYKLYSTQKADAELKLKQEAEAKVAADKLITDAELEAAKILEEAKKNITKSVTKKTITCTKGKLIKKVTAIKPKCPSGYKVKK
jgi:hypothetical protein